ncbi:hypothetical protein JKY72_05705 [Candidatus Gracilibacteria bacterium]|nr:hypothetical protein [Candidatus Gracilibacteria bacterium]
MSINPTTGVRLELGREAQDLSNQSRDICREVMNGDRELDDQSREFLREAVERIGHQSARFQFMVESVLNGEVDDEYVRSIRVFWKELFAGVDSYVEAIFDEKFKALSSRRNVSFDTIDDDYVQRLRDDAADLQNMRVLWEGLLAGRYPDVDSHHGFAVSRDDDSARFEFNVGALPRMIVDFGSEEGDKNDGELRGIRIMGPDEKGFNFELKAEYGGYNIIIDSLGGIVLDNYSDKTIERIEDNESRDQLSLGLLAELREALDKHKSGISFSYHL